MEQNQKETESLLKNKKWNSCSRKEFVQYTCDDFSNMFSEKQLNFSISNIPDQLKKTIPEFSNIETVTGSIYLHSTNKARSSFMMIFNSDRITIGKTKLQQILFTTECKSYFEVKKNIDIYDSWDSEGVIHDAKSDVNEIKDLK